MIGAIVRKKDGMVLDIVEAAASPTDDYGNHDGEPCSFVSAVMPPPVATSVKIGDTWDGVNFISKDTGKIVTVAAAEAVLLST